MPVASPSSRRGLSSSFSRKSSTELSPREATTSVLSPEQSQDEEGGIEEESEEGHTTMGASTKVSGTMNLSGGESELRGGPSTVTNPAFEFDSNVYQQNNYLIHLLYTRQEYDDCLELIEDTLAACRGQCEQALYVKALIKRQEGNIQASLQLFQDASAINPHSVSTLKQVGRSLFLLGKQRASLDVYDEAEKVGGDADWEIWHSRGLCFLQMKMAERAIDCFRKANSIQRHDVTFMQLGRAFMSLENYRTAIEVYLEALEFSPDSPEILTMIGLLYLRLGENLCAFDYLGNSLTHDPRNPKTILAAGSIIQDHADMDVALVKYRVAAHQAPNSAQLWNNIGMCFFGKRRHVAAIACLKRALYLDPFEWIISYNLGLVHLNTAQYASAFHFFSASINLKPDFASSYMYLALTLNNLDDFENTVSAYEKALEMEKDHLFELNYAITLFLNGEQERSMNHFLEFRKIFDALDADVKGADPEVEEKRQQLERLLLGP